MTPTPPHPSPGPHRGRQERRRSVPPWHPEAWGGALAELARVEVVAGIVLAAAVVVALVWANGPFQASYDRLWLRPLSWAALPTAQFHDVADLVNDGLMTVFFLVVRLEIGRERA